MNNVFHPADWGYMDDRTASLRKELSGAVSQRERARLLAELAWLTKYPDPPGAVKLGRKSLEITKETGDLSHAPKATLAVAMGHLHMSEFRKAEEAGLYGLDLYQREDNPAGIRHALNVLGSIYVQWEKLGKALDNYLEAKRIGRGLSDTPDPGILSNIGSVYMKLGNYEKALDYFLQAKGISDGMDGPADLLAAASINLGDVYRVMGMLEDALIHYEQGSKVCRKHDMKSYTASTCVKIGTIEMDMGHLTEAMQYLLEALSIYRVLGDKRGMADTLVNIGRCHIKTENLQAALNIFKDSLDIYQQLDADQFVPDALLGIADVLCSQGRFEEALDRLFQALDASKKAGSKPRCSRITAKLSELCEKAGRTDDALLYIKEHHILQEELASEKTEQRLLSLKITHQVERSRKEAEIYRLKMEELSRKRANLEETVLQRTEELERQILEKELSQNFRRQLEMELGRDRRLVSLGEHSGEIAHDFNNLLGVIAGNAELLLQIEDLSSEGSKLINRILDSAKTGSSLAGELLAFGRQQPSRKSTVYINEVVRSSLSIVERSLGSDIVVERNLCEANPAVLADRFQIEKMLINLLINAGDAISGQGTIEVSVSEVAVSDIEVPEGMFENEDMIVKLEVKDSGHGIHEKEIQRIFEPFYTTKEREAGTGLGLAVVRRVVHDHDGWITVKSQQDHGTVFSVILPETTTMHMEMQENSRN
ncbi:MAG: tetratricopeptide repeat protein [Candidatus Aegiribacteria sp.]|nr:tetratricopeptide repeat protein [Candidatus Aegiribacteria sp.]MBD3295286.1 tetratricopeptide repeat protein [Candidatus Fermentibacteria bacterium]